MKNRTPKHTVLFGLLGGIVLTAGGCLQPAGKPCQTDSDCKNGLVCCFDSVTGKGTCQETCIAPDAAEVDAAVTDGAVTDGAELDAAEPDAAEPDAAEWDAAPIDSSVDASPI